MNLSPFSSLNLFDRREQGGGVIYGLQDSKTLREIKI